MIAFRVEQRRLHEYRGFRDKMCELGIRGIEFALFRVLSIGSTMGLLFSSRESLQVGIRLTHQDPTDCGLALAFAEVG